MPLHAYRHARLIVQSGSTNAFEAARAMRTNEGGAVLVSEGGRIAGIVTDRDLALRVVGEGRDPHATILRDIATRPVAALNPEADEIDAVRSMTTHRIRRIPLVTTDERLVGLVTLDDLVLEGAVDFEDVRSVVRAQVVEGGPARTRRFDEWRSHERRYARAFTTWNRLVTRVHEAARLDTREQAARAIELVVKGLVRRLGPGPARRFIPRLPALLRSRLRDLPPATHAEIGDGAIEQEVAAALAVDLSRARAIVRVIGSSLAPVLHAADPVGRRLPAELRSVLFGPDVDRAMAQ
jgi:uncharacterized protein (DUF2267 family)